MYKTTVRFEYSTMTLFIEPLFYVGSNLNQFIRKVHDIPRDEKLVDVKLSDFDICTSMEIDIDNMLTIN